MSRTTKVKASIISIAALTAAVAELQAGGLKCELVTNAKPRLWGGDGNSPVCDFVLKLPGRFDIGFQKQGESYAPITDLHGGEVNRILGAKQRCEGLTMDETQQAHIGQLMQMYGKHASIEAAVNAGYPISSIVVLPDGSIAIEAEVLAMQS